MHVDISVCINSSANMKSETRKSSPFFSYLLLGRNIEPSINTEPDSKMYQHVLNSR